MSEETQKSANEVLAELLLEERREKAEKERVEKEQRRVRAEQRKINEADAAAKAVSVIKYCDHLMGNHMRGKEKPHREIPDLSLHTYASGKSRIRCNRCQFEWFPSDTRKSIVRNKQKLENPTYKSYFYPDGMSWNDAYKMSQSGGLIGNHPGRAFQVKSYNDEPFKD